MNESLKREINRIRLSLKMGKKCEFEIKGWCNHPDYYKEKCPFDDDQDSCKDFEEEDA